MLCISLLNMKLLSVGILFDPMLTLGSKEYINLFETYDLYKGDNIEMGKKFELALCCLT